MTITQTPVQNGFYTKLNIGRVTVDLDDDEPLLRLHFGGSYGDIGFDEARALRELLNSPQVAAMIDEAAA